MGGIDRRRLRLLVFEHHSVNKGSIMLFIIQRCCNGRDVVAISTRAY